MVRVLGIREPDSARHMLQDKGILGYFIQPLGIENQGADSLMGSIATADAPHLVLTACRKGDFPHEELDPDVTKMICVNK